MAGAQSRTSCKSLFKQSEIPFVPRQYILSLKNFIIKTQGIFKQIYLYTILIQGIRIIYIDQMSTYLVFKKVHSIMA